MVIATETMMLAVLAMSCPTPSSMALEIDTVTKIKVVTVVEMIVDFEKI